MQSASDQKTAERSQQGEEIQPAATQTYKNTLDSQSQPTQGKLQTGFEEFSLWWYRW